MRALLLVPLLTFGCVTRSYAAPDLPKPEKDLPAQKGPATAVFAAGCFWCVEAAFEIIDGVTDVVSGYAGDTKEKAVYETVGSGATKHAESVRVTYDPAKISYGRLLQVLFTANDPTTRNYQGPDHGTQYRSTIFYANEQEKAVAEAYIKQLDKAKLFPAPIVTTLEPLTEFYAAEKYHQDFVRLHPDHPYVVRWSVPKVAKIKEKLPDLVRK